MPRWWLCVAALAASASVAAASASAAASVAAADLCTPAAPADPCLPGGRYDALIGACTGYRQAPCFACFTGDLCNEQLPPDACVLDASTGDPVMLQEYWERTPTCFSVAMDYRANYQTADEAPIPPLEDAIRALHRQANNAIVDGREIVVSYGATDVLRLALQALTQRGSAPRYDVIVQAPHWAKYAGLINTTSPWRRTADGNVVALNWNPGADPAANTTLEILTWPNNPDGQQRPSFVRDPTRLITDAVYYWPQFTTVAAPLDVDLAVFSLSKQSGLAGTRLGWALVKDASVAAFMRQVIAAYNGISIDPQIRALAAMEHVRATPDGTLPPLYEFGRDLLADRWDRLLAIFDLGTSAFRVLNRADRGAFAWVEGPAGSDCDALFRAVGVRGGPGVSYGGTAANLRLNMIGRSVDMDILYDAVYRRLFVVPVNGTAH